MALLAGTAFVLDQAYAGHVADGLLPRLKFTGEGEESTIVTLYDTVDWRLWRDGLALFAEHGRLTLRSLLEERASPSLRLPPAGLFDAASLTPGVLRRRLETAVGDAGLLVLAEIQVVSERYVHRNASGKIDCRADLVQASVQGVKPLPPLLVPQPLRGYERAAQPLLDQMAEGLAHAPLPVERLRVWLHAASRRPYDTAAPTAKLHGEMAAGHAVALCLRKALASVQDRAPLAMAERDPEHLHQFRVAVRQARGLLKALGHILPDKAAKRGKKGLRWLGQVSTPVRDLDVLLAGDGQHFADSLQQALRDKRLVDQAALVRGLRSDKYARFVEKWRRDLRDVGHGGPNLRQAADAALMAAAETFIGGAQALTPYCPAEELHELRKHGKQLRYLLDFFRDLYPPAEIKALIGPLKKAQDGLGDYQDLTAHQELLERFEEARPFLASLAAQEPVRRGDAFEALAPFREPDAIRSYERLTDRAAAEVPAQ